MTVGPDGRLVFRPETFQIADDETTYPAGRTHTYTFTVAGRYVYHCDPHQSVGMRGSFTVR